LALDARFRCGILQSPYLKTSRPRLWYQIYALAYQAPSICIGLPNTMYMLSNTLAKESGWDCYDQLINRLFNLWTLFLAYLDFFGISSITVLKYSMNKMYSKFWYVLNIFTLLGIITLITRVVVTAQKDMAWHDKKHHIVEVEHPL
jgi:hypothetical protein